MSDAIVGVAILDRTLVPQQLAVLCRPAGKPDRVRIIPVYPVGTPKPATHNGAAWAYEVRGDRLFVTPSVHVQAGIGPGGAMVTEFHNGYSWNVQFREAGPREPDQGWETKHLWRDIREANP